MEGGGGSKQRKRNSEVETETDSDTHKHLRSVPFQFLQPDVSNGTRETTPCGAAKGLLPLPTAGPLWNRMGTPRDLLMRWLNKTASAPCTLVRLQDWM